MLRNKIIRFYFKPKCWEFYKGKTIYDVLGIRFYKRFLPTTGDLARKEKRITQINIANNRVNELYKYEKKTVSYEWRHLIGAIIYIIIFIIIARKSYANATLSEWAAAIIFNSILNLGINIYPIFYNDITGSELLKS